MSGGNSNGGTGQVHGPRRKTPKFLNRIPLFEKI